jgi:hypothetical protein
MNTFVFIWMSSHRFSTANSDGNRGNNGGRRGFMVAVDFTHLPARFLTSVGALPLTYQQG